MNRRLTPQTLPPPDPTTLTIEVQNRKRRLYFIASLVALPSIYFVWWFYSDTNVFIRYFYPVLIAEAMLWSIALLWRRIRLSWIEGFVLLTIGLFFLSKYAYYLYIENPTHTWKEIETIAAGMIILFILAYIILDHQLAFRLSLIYTALTFVIGLGRFYSGEMELMIDWIRLETRLIVIALLTFILAKVKDDLIVAQKKASYWEWQANIDHLTQLPNRRMISTLIEQQVYTKKVFAILLIDIDDFKCFNDTYGHDVGDVLLSRVAFTLKTNLRASDFAARWGGEEFLVLVNEATPEQTTQLAERLRSEVEKINFNEDRISISIGATLSKPRDDLAGLLKRADNALYAAKSRGRNCVCWE